jgi:hypothetical protein
MPNELNDISGYIDLKFGPRWKYIAVVRTFIQSFISLNFSQNSIADNVAMTASELLENAVKYASKDDIRVKLTISPTNDEISISVTNYASSDAIKNLKQIWDQAMVGDSLTNYVMKTKEAATRTDGKSQLGLVRIRYETKGEMNLEIVEDKVSIELVLKEISKRGD